MFSHKRAAVLFISVLIPFSHLLAQTPDAGIFSKYKNNNSGYDIWSISGNFRSDLNNSGQNESGESLSIPRFNRNSNAFFDTEFDSRYYYLRQSDRLCQ